MISADSRYEIGLFVFDEHVSNEISKHSTFCLDWPYIYIIRNEKAGTHEGSATDSECVSKNDKYLPEAYVGETYSVIRRMDEHIKGGKKMSLIGGQVIVLRHREFNKSSTLDLEQYLIRMFAADGNYKLLNQNYGQSPIHDYYNRPYYQEKFPVLWDYFVENGLIKSSNSASEIQNSSVFKYSPFISLTSQQEEICASIMEDIANRIDDCDDECTYLIMGGAGTGKTVMAVNMMSRMHSCASVSDAPNEDLEVYIGCIDEDGFHEELDRRCRNVDIARTMHAKVPELKPMFLVPMTSMKETMKEVFQKIPPLYGDAVIGPSDLKDKVILSTDRSILRRIDVLLVDESHRLAWYHNLRDYSSFDDSCVGLGFIKPKDEKCKEDKGYKERRKEELRKVNQLDWITKASRFRILFYDPSQTVRGSDIPEEDFRASLKIKREDKRTLAEISNDPNYSKNLKVYKLRSQVRCNGGDAYIEYLDRVFECRQDAKQMVHDYDFQLFDDGYEMVEAIKEKDREFGLCRTVAGYSWKWDRKDSSVRNIRLNPEDEEEEGLLWNTKESTERGGWVLSDDAINQVGCIHSIQGFDLNYVGVIMDPEISYDKDANEIRVDSSKYCDIFATRGFGKDRAKANQMISTYVKNAYKVLLTRGIRGCFVYACDKSLREYLSCFIDKHE